MNLSCPVAAMRAPPGLLLLLLLLIPGNGHPENNGSENQDTQRSGEHGTDNVFPNEKPTSQTPGEYESSSVGAVFDTTTFSTAKKHERCQTPATRHSQLILNPPNKWYVRGEKIQVKCAEGYQPSHTKIVCKHRKPGTGSEWDKNITCIQKCSKPETWSKNIQLKPIKEYYDAGENVKVVCPVGYQPSTTDLQCVKKARDRNSWNADPDCIGFRHTILEGSSNSVTIYWTCNYDNFQNIWIMDAECKQSAPCCDKTCSKANFRTSCKTDYKVKSKVWITTCRALQAFSQYDVTIYGTYKNNKQKVVLYSLKVKTSETVPDAPWLNPMDYQTEITTIKWEKLSDCKGKIQGYQLNFTAWRDYNHSFWEEEHVTVNFSVTEYTVWKPGTNYSLTIQGFTSAGLGKSAHRVFTTKITAPLIPDISKIKYNMSATDKTAVLTLHPVPDVHGPISEYQIIVSRQINRSNDVCKMNDLPPFNSKMDHDVYITAALPAHNLTSPREFSIGDGSYYHGYYNAPLHSESNYSAFLRVISIWNQDKTNSCAEYGSFIVSVVQQDTATSSGLTKALVFLVLLVILAAIGLLFFRLRSSRSKFAGGNYNGTIPLKRRTSLGTLKTAIPVVELIEAMKRFKRTELLEEEEQTERTDTDTLTVGRFAEYQKLESGLVYPCNAGSALAIKSKNRYKNIVPYDYSRVVLQSTRQGNDYINASYIDGYRIPNFFIACQGPLPETVTDFWQMVWQENSSLIVMLTDLVEQNKVKCAQYWPDQAETYGDLRVTLCRTDRSASHVMRTFSVQKGNDPEKIVEQFHYLLWPDHGVPRTPGSLLRLVHQMNEKKTPDTGPVIVHCSAGIGRTGTFIALDILLKMAKAEKKVDVLRCTDKLREKRVNMVQTVDQYIFLYDALTEGVMFGLTGIPVDKIHQHFSKMKERDPVTKINGFGREFQQLERFSEIYHLQSCVQAQKPSNQLKNRNQEILPADNNRPILMSVVDSEGSPAYINAVYVDSSDREDHFIITQLPKNETLVDFWSLVWDYRCRAVVMMNRIEDLDETYPYFWPDDGESDYGPFKVKLNSEDSKSGFTARTLSLSKGQKSTDLKLAVKFWQLDNWPMQQLQPQSPAPIINILGEVAKCQQQDSHVLVMCWDGASRSGLFCAGSIVCEQIREERLLDPSHAVRLLKSKRWQLIPDAIQYTFCFKLALAYLDSFQTYGNFK